MPWSLLSLPFWSGKSSPLLGQRHLALLDSAACHLCDLKLDAVIEDDISHNRWTTQNRQDEPADRVYFLVFQDVIQSFAQFFNPNCSSHPKRSACIMVHLRMAHGLLVNLSDHFFEQVFDRQQSGSSAMLVHDDHHLSPGLLHDIEEPIQCHCCGNQRQLSRLGRKGLVLCYKTTQNVLNVNHPGNVV